MRKFLKIMFNTYLLTKKSRIPSDEGKQVYIPFASVVFLWYKNHIMNIKYI